MNKKISFNLMNGDCLELMKSIPDKSIDLILTDPPYGTTANKWDEIIPLKDMWDELNRVLKTSGKIVLFAQCPFDKILGASNIRNLKYEWIWEKPLATGFLNAKNAPLKKHENILVFDHPKRKKPTYNPVMRTGFKPYKKINKINTSTNYGGQCKAVNTQNSDQRYPVSILQFNRDTSRFHPTQKPVALLEYFIKTYTNKNETVLDFTMGSGSTGVACKNLDRNFIGIEMDKEYFKLASDRINDHIKESSKEEKKVA